MSEQSNLTILRDTVARYHQSPEMAAFLSHIMSAESSGNNYAQNPNSTATGIFQFTKSTWDDYGRGGDIHDPNAQCDAVVRFTMDNAKVLKAVLHRDPTAGEYYLAHFAGAQGAEDVLTAAPDTSIRDLLGAKAIKANASIKFHNKSFADFTAQDLREWAGARMDADIDARTTYNKRRSQNQTTTEEDAKELATRRHLLEEFGMSDELINMLPLSGLLGDLFMALIQSFMEMSAPMAERETGAAPMVASAPSPSQTPPQVKRSQVAAVSTPRVPARA